MSADAYTEDVVGRAAEEVDRGAADAVLAVAVRSYPRFAVHARFESGMAKAVLPVLWSVVGCGKREAYPDRLEEFINRYQERLARLCTEYVPGSAIAAHGRYELLARPVSLIAPVRLKAVRLTLAGRRARPTPPDRSVPWCRGRAAAPADPFRIGICLTIHTPVGQVEAAWPTTPPEGPPLPSSFRVHAVTRAQRWVMASERPGRVS